MTKKAGVRVHFQTTAGFLAEAQRLVREDRAFWPRLHQLGHTVCKAEAEQVVYWARTANVRTDLQVEDRYLIWGPGWNKPLVRVVAEIHEIADGRVLVFVSAFQEDTPFGS